VDAPRGPSRQVKIGIVVVAKETGQPVVPMVSWATRQIRFKSWDSMILPLPFSTIVIAFGKPTDVPKGLGNEEYENLRLEIEQEMLRVQEQTESKVGQILKGEG